MCFAPVELDALNCTILKPHSCNAFEFGPASGTENLTETGDLMYPTTDGDYFDLFDCANDLKIFAGWLQLGGLKQY
jgi:hypothetical protein